jgi:hypothetical protein
MFMAYHWKKIALLMTDLLLKLQMGAQPTRKVQRIGYIFCIGKT